MGNDAAPPVANDATMVQEPKDQVAAGPISGLDATAIAPDDALAETQMDSGSSASGESFAKGSLAKGSAAKRAKRTTTAIESGTKIGRFLVTGELGAGGMGVVYAAYDPKLDRKVAIKMLHEGISTTHRSRLEREARAMAKLTHPNVVSVHEVGEFENRLFVAMEFVDGKTLRDWLTQDAPDKKQIMAVMIDAGRGLAAAHAADMVHRDFKPDNVLVGRDGRTRVSDFGLVTPVGSETIDEEVAPAPAAGQLSASALTQVGTIMGTPLYMAPEQHRGESADHRADQFSFCVTLWEALYEHTPYSAKSYEALVENVTAGRLLAPANANKGPSWIRSILTKGLSVKPAERYESMDALLRALANDPWQFRRRVALAVAGLAITGAAAAVLIFKGGASDAGAVCQGAQAQIDNVWTAERRAEIAEAFRASDVQGAMDTFAFSEKRLDSYGQEWVKLRTQSCEATHVHKEQGANLFANSMSCFDRRLMGYRSVIQLFANAPNEPVITNARKTVGGLADLNACLSRSELELGVGLPDDPIAQAEIREIMEAFEAVKRHDLRSEYKVALEKSAPLIERAIAVDYPPIEAELLTANAGLQQTLGDFDSAEKTLRQAASAAARANDDTMVANVWIRVLDLLVQQGRLDEALNMETVALTSAARVPNELGLQARLQNTLGGIYVAKARYDDAFVAYEKALGHLRATGDAEHPALAPAISNLGLANWYRGDIASAKQSFEEALEILLRDFGPDHSQVAYARKNIGDLAIQLGNDEDALVHYQEVLRIWTATLGPEHANLGYAYEQLARISQRSGDIKTALTLVDKTIAVREAALGAGHPLIVQSLSVAIEVFLAEGTPEGIERAEAAIVRALQIIDTLGEPGKTHKIYVLDSRAKLEESREDWTKALADREAVLELRRSVLGEAHNDTAYSYAQVAGVSMRLGDTKKTEAMLVAAQKIYDELPGFGDRDAIGMRRSRAQLRIEQKQLPAAMQLLQEALAKARVGTDTESMIALVEFEIAKLRYAMGEESQALGEAKAVAAQLGEEQAELRSAIDAWLAAPE